MEDNTIECTKCYNIITKDELYSHMRYGKKIVYDYCRPCFLKKKKEYNDSRKEDYKKYNSSDEVRKRRRERNKVRRKEDPAYRLTESSKARIHEVLKEYKGCTSSKLLDCSSKKLKHWITIQMDDTMNWDNYGKEWHIDHVVPISFFDITDKSQQYLAFHWSNLRPLNANKNVSKWNKIDEEYIISHYNFVKTFIKNNQEYQVSVERCLWQRMELWYGKNLQDETVSFEDKLKWAIRNQAPNVRISNGDNDENDGEGSETR